MLHVYIIMCVYVYIFIYHIMVNKDSQNNEK